MKRSLIRDHLQNLKAVLRKILGYSVTGDKYIDALDGALEKIDPNIEGRVEIEVGPFKGIMANEDGNLTVDVELLQNGENLETLVYYSKDVIDDEIVGES